MNRRRLLGLAATDIGSDAKVYTELDGGEPNCPGVDAFHNDYWIWINDTTSGLCGELGRRPRPCAAGRHR